MVRSESHLYRIMAEVQASPGMILFTLVNGELRVSLERRATALNRPTVAALDAVTDALSRMLGQEAKARPGRQHVLDAAYFARVEAIQFTVAHDDGIGWENWEQADKIGRAHVELQSLMRISYAVFCLKNKTIIHEINIDNNANIK